MTNQAISNRKESNRRFLSNINITQNTKTDLLLLSPPPDIWKENERPSRQTSTSSVSYSSTRSSWSTSAYCPPKAASTAYWSCPGSVWRKAAITPSTCSRSRLCWPIWTAKASPPAHPNITFFISISIRCQCRIWRQMLRSDLIRRPPHRPAIHRWAPARLIRSPIRRQMVPPQFPPVHLVSSPAVRMAPRSAPARSAQVRRIRETKWRLSCRSARTIRWAPLCSCERVRIGSYNVTLWVERPTMRRLQRFRPASPADSLMAPETRFQWEIRSLFTARHDQLTSLIKKYFIWWNWIIKSKSKKQKRVEITRHLIRQTVKSSFQRINRFVPIISIVYRSLCEFHGMPLGISWWLHVLSLVFLMPV